MKIHEFQAKKLLAEYGVLVPQGRVAATPEQAREAAQELGGPVVVKAQVHAGGRGKGGGIKTAATPEEAEQAATQILGMRLVTPQTDAEGKLVHRVLVEEQTAVERELYLSVLVDGASSRTTMIASAAGGVEIAEVAAELKKEEYALAMDTDHGVQPAQGGKLAFAV